MAESSIPKRGYSIVAGGLHSLPPTLCQNRFLSNCDVVGEFGIDAQRHVGAARLNHSTSNSPTTSNEAGCPSGYLDEYASQRHLSVAVLGKHAEIQTESIGALRRNRYCSPIISTCFSLPRAFVPR